MPKSKKNGATTKENRESAWGIRGVSRDARNAAKINARKEGVSIGEWLETAIWEQAKAQKPSAVGNTLEDTLKVLTETLERQNTRLDKLETSKNKSWLARLLRGQ